MKKNLYEKKTSPLFKIFRFLLQLWPKYSLSTSPPWNPPHKSVKKTGHRLRYCHLSYSRSTQRNITTHAFESPDVVGDAERALTAIGLSNQNNFDDNIFGYLSPEDVGGHKKNQSSMKSTAQIKFTRSSAVNHPAFRTAASFLHWLKHTKQGTHSPGVFPK